MNICLENPDLTNIVPFVINELQDKYNVYDILKMKLNSAEEFLIHHKELKRNDWKKISFNTYSQNMVFIKTIYKKRVDKGHKLIVKNRLNTLRPYILLPVWENIQNYLIKQIIFFYSKQSISKYKTIIIDKSPFPYHNCRLFVTSYLIQSRSRSCPQQC